MAWLKSDGTPVATGLSQLSVTIPTEAADEASATPNWIAVIMAGIQFFIALKSGDPAAIQAALQALINAFMGK